ncbi:hypothetical protein [Sphingopyxis terrae]|uniref:hypothetical protein n=1 Tax=Sphingopyxis terrae TaxID=33052 RepID=UPI002A0CAE26|nr:hypothetical protein [Sphingopyxis terrae]MDX8356811.1 hypothetical protein [Sphingopyxis terrae]
MTDYMVTGLVKRRAELAGEMLRTQAALGQMARDLETLDAAIKLVAPDLDIPAIAPKMVKPPEDWSKRGEMSRQIFAIMRVSGKPLTSREIAAQMIVQRGLASTPRLLALMTKRVSTCLRDRREQGLVRNAETRGGQYLEWELAR